ncbi:MAG TPA: hypothetical protein VNI01_10040 [Elusimicrobiota bacterium]|jgi:hypothetical protein|nr:hypothetical protein [Elusimicrobiota bacterium]
MEQPVLRIPGLPCSVLIRLALTALTDESFRIRKSIGPSTAAQVLYAVLAPEPGHGLRIPELETLRAELFAMAADEGCPETRRLRSGTGPGPWCRSRSAGGPPYNRLTAILLRVERITGVIERAEEALFRCAVWQLARLVEAALACPGGAPAPHRRADHKNS